MPAFLQNLTIGSWFILALAGFILATILFGIINSLKKDEHYNTKNALLFSKINLFVFTIALIAVIAFAIGIGTQLDKPFSRKPQKAWKTFQTEIHNQLPSDTIKEPPLNSFIIFYKPDGKNTDILENVIYPYLQNYQVYWINSNQYSSDEIYEQYGGKRSLPCIVVIYDTIDDFKFVPVKLNTETNELDLTALEKALQTMPPKE